MALDETYYDHVRGKNYMTITAAETWSISQIKRLKAQRPDEVEIRHTNPDGSMVVRMPSSWMRIVPKKRNNLTPEQKQVRSERMASMRSSKNKGGAS